jgi:hypothetical protein
VVTLAGSAASAARGSSPPGGRRPLRLLWAGQSVSLPGDQVTMLALPLAALAGGASVAQVAVLVGATRAPFLLIGVMPYFLLLAVAVILGCGSVLFQVAYQSLTPLLVEDAGPLRSRAGR